MPCVAAVSNAGEVASEGDVSTLFLLPRAADDDNGGSADGLRTTWCAELWRLALPLILPPPTAAYAELCRLTRASVLPLAAMVPTTGNNRLEADVAADEGVVSVCAEV